MLATVKEFIVHALAWLADDGTLAAFFAENLRSTFFNGLLTLGGFVLAAYSFLIIHMKAAVYDTEEYRQDFADKKKADEKLKLYGPLRRLSKKLHASVVASLVAAVVQLTVGLMPHNGTALICIVAAAVAAVCVGRSMSAMAANLGSWFDILDSHES